ncbi:hypothetical protein EG68_06862 [Paragonimus skrjabini miyazakii]|uniref:Nucleoside diphosphate-linked moiety X motif 6 n=1 Tax=Paragonimus skrjabini miyazakii TaxID=59628 RepID=A0A8S9YN28_9TREM|nr:hypothetical protein EG68_06862 [Paragonimus skrjabini miyazakii]
MVACTWSYIRKYYQTLNYSLVQLSSSSNPSITAIWVNLTLHEFHLIPLLCAPLPNGPELTFHHATGLSATLFRWLGGEPCKIPEFATHQVGVAGVVISNDFTHVLMVREKRGSAFGGWKFPTGLSHLGEDLSDVVVREVREETGVSAQFAGILAIRQQHDHPGAFGRSDLLAICRLQLANQSTNLPPIEMCHKELSDCAWIPLTKLLSACVHSVITGLDAPFLSNPEQLHITTLTHEIVRMITASSPVELRPYRLESIKRGYWYDLYLPRPWFRKSN